METHKKTQSHTPTHLKWQKSNASGDINMGFVSPTRQQLACPSPNGMADQAATSEQQNSSYNIHPHRESGLGGN